MCLKPVDLRLRDRAIRQADARHPFPLSPVALAVLLVETVEDSDAVSGGDRLDRSDLADRVEVAVLGGRLQDRASASQRSRLSGFGPLDERASKPINFPQEARDFVQLNSFSHLLSPKQPLRPWRACARQLEFRVGGCGKESYELGRGPRDHATGAVKFKQHPPRCGATLSGVELPDVDPTAMRRFDATMAAYEEALSPCIVPIYALNEERIVTAAGSAVLLQPKVDRHVLVTAGHVLDNNLFSPLMTWGGSSIGFIGLRGRAVSTEPAHPRRDEDRVDLAALELEPETVAELARTDARFAPGSVLRLRGTPDGFYSFTGYPELLNEPVGTWDGERTTYTVQRHIVSFRVQKADEADYQRVRCVPARNFVGVFDHGALIASGELTVAPGPHPRGISGGAVFYLGTADDIYHDRRYARLAGIGTEYHHLESLIVAANAQSVRSAVRALLS